MMEIVDQATQASIQRYRLEQIKRRLVEADCAAIVLFDPVQIRYATGTRNMQVWTMHNICRYAVSTDKQREIYSLAFQQMQHNVELLKPGLGLLHIFRRRGCR